jgi:hypothetical protein
MEVLSNIEQGTRNLNKKGIENWNLDLDFNCWVVVAGRNGDLSSRQSGGGLLRINSAEPFNQFSRKLSEKF